MTDRACVDASVAVKWMLSEEQTNLALGLLDQFTRDGTTIVVPPHFGSEVANAVYRRFHRGLLAFDEATVRILEFEAISKEVASPPGLIARAFAIGRATGGRAIYDALYLALADMLRCDVWTADEALYRAGVAQGVSTRLLADFSPAA